MLDNNNKIKETLITLNIRRLMPKNHLIINNQQHSVDCSKLWDPGI